MSLPLHRTLPVLLTAAICSAIGPGIASAGADDITEGRRLAERLCADCHLNPGQGEKTGRAGIPGFRAVANRPGQSIGGVVSWLRSIPPMMPNHHLSQDEMFRLAHYIMSLKQGE
jgi:mono/diheme cytochrome c family protein